MTKPAARRPAGGAFRSPMLAKIHIGKKDLGLDEDTYRALLRRVTGHDSAAACTDRQLDAVLAEFKRLGWKPAKGSSGGHGRPRFVPSPQVGKIRALWITLHQAGVVRDGGEAAMAAYVRRMTGQEVGRLDQADAGRVIEGLKAWLARAGATRAAAGGGDGG